MSKLIGFSVSSLLLTASVLPSFAVAQTAGNGLLSVYVQVVNPSGGITRNPGDFSVLVAGQNPSPSTFFGSQNGVQVSLAPGNYSVAVSGNQYGFTPSYSQGCNGSIAAAQTALCVITMSANVSNYYPYPTPYPYPFNYPIFRCEPASQRAGLRQNVQFTAVGGVGGTYNWQVPGRSYPNAGPVLTVSFDQTGSQLVTVTNGTQTATCAVEVQGYYPGYINPTPTYPGYPYQTPTVIPTYIPRLPNTGFEPTTAAQLALALALLGAVAAAGSPYIRKAFATVTR